MKDLSKIINERLSNYSQTEETVKRESYRKCQNRLKALVRQYGAENVALASGLSEKTVLQYVRVSVPPSISKAAVDKAELILEGL